MNIEKEETKEERNKKFWRGATCIIISYFLPKKPYGEQVKWPNPVTFRNWPTPVWRDYAERMKRQLEKNHKKTLGSGSPPPPTPAGPWGSEEGHPGLDAFQISVLGWGHAHRSGTHTQRGGMRTATGHFTGSQKSTGPWSPSQAACGPLHSPCPKAAEK